MKLISVENVLKKVLISRHSVCGIPCSLWARRSGVGIAAGARDLCLVQSVQFSCGTHPASSSFSTGVLCPGYCDLYVTLTTPLRLVPRLRISEDVPPLHLYALVACTESAVTYLY